MYTFVRVHKKNTTDYGTWYFEPKSVDEIKEHWKVICGAEIKETVDDHVKNTFNNGLTSHSTTQFGMGVEAWCQVINQTYAGFNPGMSFLFGALNVENEAYNSRIKQFERGDKIYLANGMTVYGLDERFYEIVETVEKETLSYPTKSVYTTDDVKYMQWNMLGNKGQHWYAKVDKYDVRDAKDNMKWDTKVEAEEAAKWFLDNFLNR
jgi:hypothetical protein